MVEHGDFANKIEQEMKGLSEKERKRMEGDVQTAQKQHSVWQGPEKDGITFSLLSRFLVCRERFRILVVDGLKSKDDFNHRLEFGNMWHVCEEAWAKGKPSDFNVQRAVRGEQQMRQPWHSPLVEYARQLCHKYPTQQKQVDHWYNVCLVQFPHYISYWSKNKSVVERTPLLQEEVFDVPYSLPSGRTVRLRGKWDSIDLIGKKESPDSQGIYLQENKTKGDIVPAQLQRQLLFDLQTMMYLVALTEWQTQPGQYRLGGEGIPRGIPIRGVIYNVVRRPLSGGKYSIVRHKPSRSNPEGESKESYYKRLGTLIKGDPAHFFMRWRVEITPSDIERFKVECLNPILEQLCDWWNLTSWHTPFHEGQVQRADRGRPVRQSLHFRFPYGVYNPLLEGGMTELDHYLTSGSELGLERVENLFPELSS